MLHETLTSRTDPVHLFLVVGLTQITTSRYTLIACDLRSDQPAEAAGNSHCASDFGPS